MAERTCALTGRQDKYVKAHLIPVGLTKHSVSGSHFIQAGEGDRPKKRWTSWYDPHLVTAEGERILADYDDGGINALRDLRLVWSSWDGHTFEFSDEVASDKLGRGIRIIENADGIRLRLFFLSLLWRAAASSLPEFRCIRIPRGQLNRLGTMLVERDPKPQFLFPMSLVQIKTKGERHNVTPVPQRKPRGSYCSPNYIRIFRFYFDGLIVHFHRDLDRRIWREMGGFAVGAHDKLGVVTIPYEVSAQADVVTAIASEAEREWPDVIERLTKS